ncbi:hypothetical protein LQZ19_01285 [Treponema primitia]
MIPHDKGSRKVVFFLHGNQGFSVRDIPGIRGPGNAACPLCAPVKDQRVYAVPQDQGGALHRKDRFVLFCTANPPDDGSQ